MVEGVSGRRICVTLDSGGLVGSFTARTVEDVDCLIRVLEAQKAAMRAAGSAVQVQPTSAPWKTMQLGGTGVGLGLPQNLADRTAAAVTDVQKTLGPRPLDEMIEQVKADLKRPLTQGYGDEFI